MLQIMIIEEKKHMLKDKCLNNSINNNKNNNDNNTMLFKVPAEEG